MNTPDPQAPAAPTPATPRTPDDVRNNPRPGDKAQAFNGHITYLVRAVDAYNVLTTACDPMGELGEVTVPRSDWVVGDERMVGATFVPGDTADGGVL